MYNLLSSYIKTGNQSSSSLSGIKLTFGSEAHRNTCWQADWKCCQHYVRSKKWSVYIHHRSYSITKVFQYQLFMNCINVFTRIYFLPRLHVLVKWYITWRTWNQIPYFKWRLILQVKYGLQEYHITSAICNTYSYDCRGSAFQSTTSSERGHNPNRLLLNTVSLQQWWNYSLQLLIIDWYRRKTKNYIYLSVTFSSV